MYIILVAATKIKKTETTETLLNKGDFQNDDIHKQR